jgi:antitoxin VapB
VSGEAPWPAPSCFAATARKPPGLPKDVAFPYGMTDVSILRDSVRRVIVPASTGRDDFFAASSIDLVERRQPLLERRDVRLVVDA